ncbi:hypothetical protein [Streptomyces spiralis]
MTAIVGLVTSLTALWVTLADRRRAIAKERREEAAAERRATAGEAAERARSARRAVWEEMAQAMPVQLRLISRPAGDDPASAPETWLVAVANRGPLPVTDVQVIHASGTAMPNGSEPFDLQGDSTEEVAVPNSGERPRLADITMVFTDAAGRRWQRRLTGGLCLGTLQDDGTCQWDEPRFPETATPPSGISAGATALSRSSGGCLALLVPLLVLTALGYLIYILLR